MSVCRRVFSMLFCCILLANVPVPAADGIPNAALKYWQAFSTMPPIGEKLNEKITVACSEAGFAHNVDKQLAELTIKGEYSLRMLHHGASIRSCDWGADLRADGAETVLPHLAKARQLARLALVRARLSLERQDDEKALDDIIAAMTIARHVSRDGTIVGIFVAYSIDRNAMQVLAAYLPAIEAELVQRTMERRRSAPSMMPMQEKITQEELFLDWAIDKLQADDEGQLLDFCSTLTTSEQQNEEMRLAVGDRRQCLEYLGALRPLYAEMRTILTLPPEQFELKNAELTKRVQANAVARFVTPNVAAMYKASNVFSCRDALLDAAVAIHADGPSALASHRDPFGDGPLEYVAQPSVGNREGSYRLNSRLEHQAGKLVTLAVGVAAR